MILAAYPYGAGECEVFLFFIKSCVSAKCGLIKVSEEVNKNNNRNRFLF